MITELRGCAEATTVLVLETKTLGDRVGFILADYPGAGGEGARRMRRCVGEADMIKKRGKLKKPGTDPFLSCCSKSALTKSVRL